jgi:two-component system chemotaxis sensor kinase CheA
VSGPVDLADFRGPFLGEADELIRIAHESLLGLDGSERAGKPNVRALRELFRAVHTLKGLSAMVGIEPIVTIAHRMESALRQSERGGGRLS